MDWFAAHAIMYLKFKTHAKGPIPVWENVLLVRARDEASAARIAAKLSKQAEGDAGGRMEMGGRRGSLTFAGIRVVRLLMDTAPRSGVEVGYMELSARDLTAVRALAAGKEAKMTCEAVGFMDYSHGWTRRKR